MCCRARPQSYAEDDNEKPFWSDSEPDEPIIKEEREDANENCDIKTVSIPSRPSMTDKNYTAFGK